MHETLLIFVKKIVILIQSCITIKKILYTVNITGAHFFPISIT